MDNKITLSFDESVISKAKQYAERNNISVSRLVEFLLRKVASNNYSSLEDFPISDWVQQVAEGEAVYQTKQRRTRKVAKEEFFKSRK
jgi:antitoxin component of RelBE/YafQ-DinJ toxin-antitoxin module